MRTLVLMAAAVAACLPACSSLSKVDYRHALDRDGWQRPEQVIESLRVRPGEHVADIGAGDGYFTFLLADAVGPGGLVYAVETDAEKVRLLSDRVFTLGYRNIVVIWATPEDPFLPDGRIDLIFLCNTYHHIENRVAYFRHLRTDLEEVGHVAIIDVRGGLFGRLILPARHRVPPAVLRAEMDGAGYRHVGSYDYLPAQSFDLFAVVRDVPSPNGAPGRLS